MIYIPDQWLKDNSNQDKVHEIISSAFHTDINLQSRVNGVIERLREIGEDTIADKLKNGDIIIPI
jgi:hypothetical protein